MAQFGRIFLGGCLAIWLVLAGSASAKELAPTTYASASGRLTLEINPSERSGAGPAGYTLLRDAKPAWSKTLPFTLQQALVSDDGKVVGYAYSQGNDSDDGEFIVALIAVTGEIVLHEATPRQSSSFLHTDANPHATGLFLDADDDRFVVRVADPDINTHAESWWTYRLSDGQRLDTANPRQHIPSNDNLRELIDARPVPGTPLIVQHWLRQDSGVDGYVQYGAHFTLVDQNLAPVWTLDLAGDYDQGKDEAAKFRLRETVVTHGALSATKLAQFELWHVNAAAQVTYRVRRTDNTAAPWSVEQLTRRAYAGPAHVTQKARAADPAPLVLRSLGAIHLGDSAAIEASAIHDVSAFALDESDRFGFVRDCACKDEPPHFVLVDADGRLVRELALTVGADVDHASFRTTWLEGNHWLVSWSSHSRNTGTVRKIDVGSGQALALAEFPTDEVNALSHSDDGGFVALITQHFQFTRKMAVVAFDRQGKQRWRTDEGAAGDPTQLFAATDLTVARSGEVVVLSTVSKTLQLFGRDGRYRRTLDLQAWGHTPNYPTNITAGAGDDVVIRDFNGNPPIVQMRLDGSVVNQFAVKFASGREAQPIGRVHVATDGSFWSSDGDALLRQDSHGNVTRVLGSAPDATRLYEVSTVAVTSAGAIYAADRRSGAVHVFDSRGTRQHVARPLPNDYSDDVILPSLSVADSGDVFIARNQHHDASSDDFLHYAPDGTRVGVVAIALDDVSPQWISQPGSDRRWMLGDDSVYLVSAQGKVLATLDRSSDGQWLTQPNAASAAADGSIAIVSDAPASEGTERHRVTIVSASGQPIRTWPAPDDVVAYAGGIAFDGTHTVMLIDDDDATTPPSLVLSDARGNAAIRATLSGIDDALAVFLVTQSAQTEIWVFDGKRSLQRFALPDRAAPASPQRPDS